jgi:hypothetical protein
MTSDHRVAGKDFERPAAADKARQARHGAAAGDCAAAYGINRQRDIVGSYTCCST